MKAMILRQPGAEYVYDGTVYTVGAAVMATNASGYSGLLGTIVEIRVGAACESGSGALEIICSFESPVIPAEAEKLEKNFSGSIPLQRVVMKPDMIQILQDRSKPAERTDVWVVLDDWANNGDFGSSIQLFASFAEARRRMLTMLRDELASGCLPGMQSNSQFELMSEENCYEAWLEGEYTFNHYRIALESVPLVLAGSKRSARQPSA